MKMLEEERVANLVSENDLLTIFYRPFFRKPKEFLFVLNGKPVFGCKTKKIARKKIEKILSGGFQLADF